MPVLVDQGADGAERRNGQAEVTRLLVEQKERDCPTEGISTNGCTRLISVIIMFVLYPVTL